MPPMHAPQAVDLLGAPLARTGRLEEVTPRSDRDVLFAAALGDLSETQPGTRYCGVEPFGLIDQ